MIIPDLGQIPNQSMEQMCSIHDTKRGAVSRPITIHDLFYPSRATMGLLGTKLWFRPAKSAPRSSSALGWWKLTVGRCLTTSGDCMGGGAIGWNPITLGQLSVYRSVVRGCTRPETHSSSLRERLSADPGQLPARSHRIGQRSTDRSWQVPRGATGRPRQRAVPAPQRPRVARPRPGPRPGVHSQAGQSPGGAWS